MWRDPLRSSGASGRLPRMVMFKNKMKIIDEAFSKLQTNVSSLRFDLVTDCMPSLLHKIFFHTWIFCSYPCPAKQILFPEPHGCKHSASPLHSLLPCNCFCCTQALVPTSFDQEHGAWWPGQGPRWGLNLCPPGLVLF